MTELQYTQNPLYTIDNILIYDNDVYTGRMTTQIAVNNVNMGSHRSYLPNCYGYLSILGGRID